MAGVKPTAEELYTYARWCETPALVQVLVEKYGLSEDDLREMALDHVEALVKVPPCPPLEELYKVGKRLRARAQLRWFRWIDGFAG